MSNAPLLPDRNVQGDFFVADIFDAAPKGDQAGMAYPIFSISTKPDHKVRRYENGDSFLEVIPSGRGLATVHDRDVLIYCISQIMAALNEGREVSPTLRFKAHDLLRATNRGTDGRGYEQLRAAFERLAGTLVTTNVTTGDVEILDGFSLIDRFRIVRETRDGRMQDVEIRLSDWVFNAINGREVLTISRDYFRLRKPLERRLYELARKHCGNQPRWEIRLDNLQSKCGSYAKLYEFRRMFLAVMDANNEHGHIPHYDLSFDRDRDVAIFHKRGSVDEETTELRNALLLDPDTFETARLLAPGWDIYHIEQEWRSWMINKGETPRSPDVAFLGFVRKFVKLNKL